MQSPLPERVAISKGIGWGGADMEYGKTGYQIPARRNPFRHPLPGIFQKNLGYLPLGRRDILGDNLPDNFVINGKIMMNNFVSEAHDGLPGHFGMPVPDVVRNCGSRLTNLLYVSLNGIDRLFAENELLI